MVIVYSIDSVLIGIYWFVARVILHFFVLILSGLHIYLKINKNLCNLYLLLTLNYISSKQN